MANNTGTFFNVNDNDGIPLVGVSTNGKVMINHLYGNCLIGSTSVTGTAKLQVTGDVSASNILPPTDNTGVIGNTDFTWSNGHFTNLTVNSTLTVRNAIELLDSDALRFGTSEDVQLFYNGTTNVLNIELESTANQIAITDNGTQRFTFTKSGNLGIGTTNPLQRLQIGTANTLGINTTGTVFVVTSNADVGIGTTNPTSKLHVIGDGRFTGIITATGGFIGSLTGTATTATTALGFSTTASINTTGIITATRFVGTLVGIASTATTALGLSTTASINTTGIITATRFVGTLVGIASTATTANNVSSTININTTGIITASSFTGNLVGIASTANNVSSNININTTGIITATGGFSGMWISAKNFGAKGDGTTNDTVAIQNALNSLTSGGTLYIPPGTYIVSAAAGTDAFAAIGVPSNVRIVGAGVSATCIKQSGSLTNKDLVSSRDNNNINIEHITFDGNNITNSGNESLLSFVFTDNISVKNCSFIKFNQQGLFLNSVVNGIVKDNYFYKTSTASTQNQALTVSYSNFYTPLRLSYNIIVDSNTFINSATIFACHSSIITNNYIKGFEFGAGITIDVDPYYSTLGYKNVYNIHIDKNIITGGSGTDVNVYKCGGIENWAFNSKITNNVIYGNSGAGIDQGGKYCIVSDNLIYDNGITSPGNAGIAGRVLMLSSNTIVDKNFDSSYSTYINNIVGLTTSYTGTGQSYGYQDQTYPSNSTVPSLVGSYPLGVGSTITGVTFINNNFSAFTGNKTGEIYTLGSKYSLDVRKNGNIGIGTTNPTAKLHIGAATTSAAGGAPLKIGAGTVLLTTPEVGAIEYNGSFLYQTPNSTSGRAYVPPVYSFRLTANGANIGATIADFFATLSSLSLEASSVYKITCFAYFTKTTAGTATWTQVFSSAPTIVDGFHYVTPVTGMTAATSISAAYTPLQQYFYQQNTTFISWNPSATNLTTTVNHFYRLDMTVVTNAATNWRLRLTQSAGTAAPLAGSYYTIEKVGPSTGTFVA